MTWSDPAPIDLHDDDTLVALLGAALDERDPVPPSARSVAVAAFDLGQLEGELAVVVADSASDAPLAGARHDESTDRYVAIEASDLHLEIDLPGTEPLVIGQIDPPGVDRVTVEFASAVGGVERIDVAVDDLGRFQAPLRPGALRLHLTTGSGPVVTPWILR